MFSFIGSSSSSLLYSPFNSLLQFLFFHTVSFANVCVCVCVGSTIDSGCYSFFPFTSILNPCVCVCEIWIYDTHTHKFFQRPFLGKLFFWYSFLFSGIFLFSYSSNVAMHGWHIRWLCVCFIGTNPMIINVEWINEWLSDWRILFHHHHHLSSTVFLYYLFGRPSSSVSTPREYICCTIYPLLYPHRSFHLNIKCLYLYIHYHYCYYHYYYAVSIGCSWCLAICI